MESMPTKKIVAASLLAALAVAFVSSLLGPADLFTWFLEVAPVIIGGGILLATHRRFPLSGLVYVLLWFHALVLIYGGAYTYAANPLFGWIKESLDLERNYYDRLGHFVQGFVPALLAREVLLRKSPLEPGKWLFFIVVCICLSVSALYELIEWWVAAAQGASAEAFLGTQGDIWDAQWDMFLALCGAITAQMTLGRFHDASMSRLSAAGSARSATAGR